MEIQSTASFLQYWQSIRGRTERIVRTIPPDQLEWTYREGRFTLGDLVRHLALLQRYMFAENICGRPSSYPGHQRRFAEGYDSVLELLERTNRETIEIIQAMPDERLQELCETPGGARLPVWKWLRAMVEHEVHHRGQIYIYLGMLEVSTPPLYGLTAEEVLERSLPQT